MQTSRKRNAGYLLWKGGIGAVVGIAAAILIAERQRITQSKND